MTVYFKHSEAVENAYLAVADSDDASYSSEYYTNPNDEVVFQAVINTGHSGTVSDLSWYFSFGLRSENGGGTVTWTWDYLGTGGSWTEFDSGSVQTLSATINYDTSTGILTGLSLTLPIQIRMQITDADENWRLSFPFTGTTPAYEQRSIMVYGSIA
jgi:hypothetical protein